MTPIRFVKTTTLHLPTTFMRRNLSIALALLTLISLAPLLGACHTTAGAGRDLSATGHAITGTARENTP